MSRSFVFLNSTNTHEVSVFSFHEHRDRRQELRHSFDFLLANFRASRWVKRGVPTKKSQFFCWQFWGQCSFSERIAGRLPMETCPVPDRKKTLSRLQHEK